MMYVGESAWHGLGVQLPNLATSAEAMEHAGLDYRVDKKPIYLLGEKSREVKIEHTFATLRTDTETPLGIVGERYRVLQNRDAFEFFDALVGRGEAIYETAGVLGRGEKIWLLAKLPGYVKVGSEDIINKYLLLTNTHDGSSVVRAKLTPIRVVCQNTLSVALSGSEQEVRIRHTRNAVEKLKEAHRLLGLTNQVYEQLSAIFNRMQLRTITSEELLGYVQKLVPDNDEAQHYNTRTRNIREKILELHEGGAGAEWTRGTAFGLVNAVSEFTDHVQHTGNPEKRLQSVWFGSGLGLKEKAFSQALELLKN
jgi:phage/plasmid-like protein (TIGR03299 family)